MYPLAPFCLTMAVLLALLLSPGVQAVEAPAKSGFALLLGVANYEPGSLPNLSKPCHDIDFLADALNAIPEIKVFDKQCDLSAAEIRNLVTQFHDELANQPIGTFGLIYFAGHGVELADDVYLFGKQAKPTAAEVKERLRRRALPGGELIPPFKRESAVALLGDLSPGNTAGNPVIVVVDACRSTPFGREIKGSTAGASLFQIRPQTDTLLAFSAAHGSEALDSVVGLDVSPYAKAFGDAILQSDSSVTDLFSVARRNLRGILRADVSKRRQEPAELNALESRVCLSGCNQCSVRSSERDAKNALISLLWQWSSSRLPTIEPIRLASLTVSDVVGRQQSLSTTVWDIDTSPEAAEKLHRNQLGPMRLDVFWCDSSNTQDSRRRAQEAADRLAGFAQAGNTVGETMLSKIRLRRLSAEKNAESGYQLSGDLIRYSPGSDIEANWTRVLRETLAGSAGKLVPSPVSTETPGYISLFFCAPDTDATLAK